MCVWHRPDENSSLLCSGGRDAGAVVMPLLFELCLHSAAGVRLLPRIVLNRRLRAPSAAASLAGAGAAWRASSPASRRRRMRTSLSAAAVRSFVSPLLLLSGVLVLVAGCGCGTCAGTSDVAAGTDAAPPRERGPAGHRRGEDRRRGMQHWHHRCPAVVLRWSPAAWRRRRSTRTNLQKTNNSQSSASRAGSSHTSNDRAETRSIDV
jgi:hypothetical protein